MIPVVGRRGVGAEARESEVWIRLLGGFALETGTEPLIPLGAVTRRLLALLALRGQPISRGAVIGVLWPDIPEPAARARLRSILSRLDAMVRGLLVITRSDLGLAPLVEVDWRNGRILAHEILHSDGQVPHDVLATIATLSSELLPGWSDTWVLEEAREWHDLRVRALEALTERCLANGRHSDGAEAALASIRADPYRESARAGLIRVHLTEGNTVAAVNEYQHFAELIANELGLVPTERLKMLALGSADADRYVP
jgi:SARP family transcriptional regulator, regulator of embCAB operon